MYYISSIVLQGKLIVVDVSLVWAEQALDSESIMDEPPVTTDK